MDFSGEDISLINKITIFLASGQHGEEYIHSIRQKSVAIKILLHLNTFTLLQVTRKETHFEQFMRKKKIQQSGIESES